MIRWLVVAMVAVLGAGCSASAPAVAPGAEPSDASPLAPDVKDFSLVAYQGESVLGGREVSFSRLLRQAKPVVLNFWAGQCPPCRAEMPEFQRVADEFEGRVIFLGLDVGVFTGLGSREDAQRLLEELGVRYPAAYAVDASPIEIYRIGSMPSTIFLRANGEVQERRPGRMAEEELRSAVQKLAT